MKLNNNCLLLFLMLIFISCKTEEDLRLDCIPNLSFQIESPFYLDFSPGTTKIINGVGVKGILLYKTTLGIVKAYDLQVPHLCPSESCSKLEVEGVLATACDVSFSLEDGQPFGTDRGLITYVAVENNGSVIITN